MISPQENVSPFDVNMACDAGYDLVIPYTNVNLTDVKSLVQDAIFSRSVSNAKKTGIGLVGVKKSGHYGLSSYYIEKAVKKKLKTSENDLKSGLPDVFSEGVDENDGP